jgi:O-antigen ligase
MSFSAILFLTGFVVGCVLALVRNPVYGLLTYIATLYMDPTGQWWGKDTLPHLRWEVIPAVVTLIAMLMHRRQMPSPVFKSGAFWGFVVFVAWLIIQLGWTLDPDSQSQLIWIWSKFLLVSIMICGCVDSWKNLRLVLWVHVIGCAYMGWVAYGLYHGGRFEGFGLSSIGEANVAALQLTTGLLVAASLFLEGSWRVKAALFVPIGLIVDGIIMTGSRSGFLAIMAAGVAFFMCTPARFKRRVAILSLLAAIGFIALTTASYWDRMHTIQYAGSQIEGVDTGGARMALFEAQWRMFTHHPFGCGHQCTELLSPEFLPPEDLALGLGKRASHNTFMSMLVDHGIPGVALYLALLAWTAAKLKSIGRQIRDSSDFAATAFPAFVAVMVAITVADLFAQLPRLEVRVWFVSLIIAYAQLVGNAAPAPQRTETAGKALEPQAA